ncbi:MAG: Dna2/Cas4 domain-containing protein, partial [Bacteroidia bacterium]
MSYILKPLSKYPFLKARECVKALYLNYHYPGLAAPPDEEQLMNFSTGNKVGLIGRQLHPGGIDLSDNNKVWGIKLLDKTQKALKTEQSVFYEAAFTTKCKQFVCRVDILKREKSRNVVVEVKSSTSLSFPEHILDVGFQYKILKEVFNDKPLVMYLAFLNKDYVRKNSLNVKELFTVIDVTERAKAVQGIIEKYINIFSKVLKDNSTPEVEIGEQCTKPFKCAFYDYCWKDIPKYSVWNISRI